MNKYVGIFSHPDLEKLEKTVVGRGVKRTDVQNLFEQVYKKIIDPLETLNKNRPGNQNNEAALKVVATLYGKWKDVVASQSTATTTSPDDTSPDDFSSRNSGPS
jgi:hypothetical protein